MKTTEYSYPSNLALVHPETSSGLNLQDLDSASQSGEDDLSAGLSGGCTGEPRPYKMSQTPNERRFNGGGAGGNLILSTKDS